MFDKTIIKAAAVDLIGFNTSIHSFFKYLSSHKTSDSGYWINSLQGADFYTIEASIPTEVKGVNLVVGERYEIMSVGGDFVNVGAADNLAGTKFVATGVAPTSWGASYLNLISCNQYLDDVYNEEVVNLMSRFIANSKDYLKQNTLLANHSVIGGVADMSKTITKSGRFVGFVLQPHEGNNVVNTITKLGFLGDAADSGLKLYLYETSQDAAIATFEFDYTTPLSQQWKDVSDFLVKYDNTRTITAGQGASVKSYSNSNTETVVADTLKVITFDNEFISTDYNLSVTVYDASGGVQPATWTIESRLKTGFSITCPENGSVEYIAIHTVSSTYTDNTYSGGIGQKYILGYFEADLTCNAIKMEFNQSLKNFSVFGKYMSVYPVAIPSANLDGYKLPSKMLDLENYITENTHGVYFKFTANCDYTNLLEDNINMFAESLQYAIAIRILQDAVASVGEGVHNSTKDASIPEWRSLISKYSGELYGGYMSIGSDQSIYKKGLIELLTMDFSGLDCVCMKKDFRHEYGIGNLM